MSHEFQIFDTNIKHKNKARQAIVDAVQSGSTLHQTNDIPKIVFDDKEFSSKEDAVAYLRENAKEEVLAVKLTSRTLTKLQVKKIDTIQRIIETNRDRVAKCKKDLDICTDHILNKIRVAKKRQKCNFCGSLIPTLHLLSHSCPVCNTNGAFLTDQAAHSIQIRKERHLAAKAKLDYLVSTRATKISLVESENNISATTWFAGYHCKF
ncbi:hypothetical protein [Photobacterium damselae]|uniref:hypothetical protein n=1 Tax=Photobacterium damselae TaxID=38293 RepID=UPI001F382EB5|nr:hypothetical protein [Photobacterium damselae]UKA04864.1 hypothetical protein IHC89_21715 [Photobacterium damselae subsp. damselae]